jgi:uncharacterized protein YsxB (DUF464 family)
MVTIELTYRNESIVAYDLSGHALSRNRGQEFDLVCAAVSVLAITTTNGLTEIIGIKPKELLVEDGRLRCVLPAELSNEQTIQADTLSQTLVMGLECLAAAYPKHVHIVRRRCAS